MLKFLILRAESEVLAEYVALLDPFPPAEPFSKLCQKQAELKELMGAASLSEEIQRFLSLGQECPRSSRREGLKALQTLLHTTWLEVSCLIQRGESSFQELRGRQSKAVILIPLLLPSPSLFLFPSPLSSSPSLLPHPSFPFPPPPSLRSNPSCKPHSGSCWFVSGHCWR